jgi:uncharacterized protein (DUF1697 family)
VSKVHVALLRAVNVGGRNHVAMADLCRLLTHLKFVDPRSVLQSGNLVFRGSGRTAAQVERLLEAEAEKRLHLETDVFVRTADEWKALIARNPFRKEAERDPARLAVVFLKGKADVGEVEALQAAVEGPEIVRAGGRHLYIIYPNGQGRSRLTNAVIERRLGTRGTARNWNTVLRLEALAGS